MINQIIKDAEQGNPEAQYELGKCYESGAGIEKKTMQKPEYILAYSKLWLNSFQICRKDNRPAEENSSRR